MNWKSRVWMVGPALLIVGFVFSAWPVLRRSVLPDPPDQEILRIGHRQLDPGMRHGFDWVARRYEELNPSVRIEYLEVPPPTFLTWLTTQFTGGMAPDIVEVVVEMTDENVARNFLALSTIVQQPNPYNRSTSLEETSWRNTFVDGLATAPGYREAQLEVFGIPTSLVTSRYYYNKTLYHQATGRTAPPQDFDELLAVCREIKRWAAQAGRVIMPLAGSKEVYLLLAARVFGQQTQRLALKRGDPLGTLRTSPFDLHLWLAQDSAGLRAKPLAAGLAIMHELAEFMPPGFMGATRADAVFHFGQQRTIIMMGRSNIYHSLMQQVDFDVGVFALPLPGPEHPRYGGNARGELTEIEQNASAALGITRFARNPQRALDFLHFLSSASINRDFAQNSRMLPVIVEVEPQAELAPFAPREGGYPYGFSLTVGGAADRRERVVFSNLHLLFGPGGTPEAFLQVAAPAYAAAAKEDLLRSIRNSRRSLARQDTLHAALGYLAKAEWDDAPAADRKQRELEERTTLQEFLMMWADTNLDLKL